MRLTRVRRIGNELKIKLTKWLVNVGFKAKNQKEQQTVAFKLKCRRLIELNKQAKLTQFISNGHFNSQC